MLNGQLHSPLFLAFMRHRTTPSYTFNAELVALIQQHLNQLKQTFNIQLVLVLPSTTWVNRQGIATLIETYLKVPTLLECLQWQTLPEARQGTLLNNDQRRQNVAQRMQVKFNRVMPLGDILLVDDYMGSGATMKEAARALRQTLSFKHALIPFTIASVKWRLGKSGMI